jgi:hypothetical protein
MHKWLQILFSLAITLQGASLSDALNELKENPHGFALVDVGITDLDLAAFCCMDIQKSRVYHQFGGLETTKEIADFFCAIGVNAPTLALQTAARLTQIAQEVVKAANKETAWLHLRSFNPTDAYDIPHWHTDGRYYISEDSDKLIFKFVLTLKGPSTLFYLLPPELRKTAERHMSNRSYMKTFCQPENIVIPKIGEGAIFLSTRGGGPAALHSEPPIHENRLFFSLIPCLEKELDSLKARIVSAYPKQSIN